MINNLFRHKAVRGLVSKTLISICMCFGISATASAGLVAVLDGRLTSISAEIFPPPFASTLEANGIVELVGGSPASGTLFVNIDYDESDPTIILGPHIELNSVDDGSLLGDAILRATSINSSGASNIEINGTLQGDSFLGLSGDPFYMLIAGLSDNDLVGGFGPLSNEGTFEVFTEASVPTPATLALFGLGLAGLGWSRRKRA